MTGFEPRISVVGSNRSTNCANTTTTAQRDFYKGKLFCFFKKWANPSLFFIYFCLFEQKLQFLQQINVKMSIQYPVLGFELTTF